MKQLMFVTVTQTLQLPKINPTGFYEVVLFANKRVGNGHRCDTILTG